MTPTPKEPAMTEWTPKAGEDAVVRVVSRAGDVRGHIGISVPGMEWSPYGYAVPVSALRPLPSALSAEDEAVLRAADAWFDDGLDVNASADRLAQAVRFRRHPTPPAGEPALKVGDRVRDTRLSARMGTPVFGRIVEISGDACAVHFDYERRPQSAPITPLADLEAAPEVPQDSAWQPGVAPPALKIATLERAVVEAAKEQVRALDAKGGQPSPEWDDATSATEKAARALLAALAPQDPVMELREAAADVDAVIDGLLAEAATDTASMTYDRLYAATCAAARLRAALSALGDRGPG